MTRFATTSSRWAALQSRDPAAASAFIYSVVTTKIYCRPTCPSRLARRANIVFHDTSFDAETDGFRPCKRCHPQVMENDGDPQRFAVEKACELLEEDFFGGGKTSIKTLAARVGLTECHFCRVFKKVKGVTVGEYKRQLASLQDLEDHQKETVDSGQTSASVASPDVTQGEFTYNLTRDDFGGTDLASASWFELDQFCAESILTSNPYDNNIFDCVDFGDSFC